MSDLISRKSVLDAFDCSIGGVPFDSVQYVLEYADKMMSKISALPSAQLIQCKECVYGNKMKDTIRCELMDYLPVECDHFCSWAERVIDE